MATTIFSGARAALANVPYSEQAKMIQAHNASTRTVRSKDGSRTLRGSQHYLRDNNGAIRVFHVLSEGRGIAADNVIIMTGAEAKSAQQYMRSLPKTGRRY